MLHRLSRSTLRREIHSIDAPTLNNGSPLLQATPCDLVQALSAAAKSSSHNAAPRYHSPIVKLGLTSNIFVNTALLDVYCKRGSLASARSLFDEMPERNVVTWNTLIHRCSLSHTTALAVQSYAEMNLAGISPSPSSVSSVLVACSRLRDLWVGTMVHGCGLKRGFCSDVVVGTSLVDMYSKCSDVLGARRVFDEMPERNVVTWTSLVTGYSLVQRPVDAMLLVREMRRLRVRMNIVTYNSLLTSFSRHEDLEHGRQVHCLVVHEGLESDPYVAVTLVTMYSKCGCSEDFVKLAAIVSAHDQITCNSVISGFAHLGDGREAIERFSDMRRKSIDLDFFTFASVLKAIGIISALEEGRQAHAVIFKTSHACNVCVQNGLVSMYAKCGAIDDSKLVFSSLTDPDLVSWNSLLSGCAQHGYGKETVELFKEMIEIGVRPNHTTFISVLTGCSHVGFVDEGLQYFYMMGQFDPPIVAGLEHYACVVDLLGRSGCLDEAVAFINKMPVKPGVSVYRSLLSACQVHGNVEIANYAADRLFDLCPNDPSTHVLLSNVLAGNGWWDNAAGLRKTMAVKGVRKNPGRTWVEDRTDVGLYG